MKHMILVFLVIGLLALGIVGASASRSAQLPAGVTPGLAAAAAVQVAPAYAIINVPENGVLSIRSGPGRSFSRVGGFGATQRDVPLTGAASGKFPRVWYQVLRTGGGSGWIGGCCVTEYHAPQDFCADSRARAQVDAFGQAFILQDGESLGKLVSPLHGMTVRLFREGTAVNYLWYAPGLFASTYPVDWGKPPGGTTTVVAAFPEAFTPPLQRVFQGEHQFYCDDASSANSPGVPAWPPEYANVNYYAVHQPASADGTVKASTWLIGVDYVNGAPYIFAIIQFPG
jgi:hypothetical protein